MAYDLDKSNLASSLANAGDNSQMQRYTDDRDVQHIYKQGLKHVVEERVQAAKAVEAEKLAAQIMGHAHATSDKLMGDMYGRLQTTGRTAAHQARLEAYTERLLDDHEANSRSIASIGTQNVARAAAKPVDGEPKKRWWER